MKKTEIISYDPKYKFDYILINLTWLITHDILEDIDKEMLRNPYDRIINNGGMIFLAKVDDKIAGTISVLKHADGIFELAKFGVDPEFQSMGIGSQLFETALRFAEENQAKTIELYSHSDLEAALALYGKYGFESVDLDDSHYDNVDIKMVKKLSE